MTDLIKPDFGPMTGPQLVEAYNAMVLTATDLGFSAKFCRPVARFPSAETGRRRCEGLWMLVADAATDAAAPRDEDRPAVAPTVAETAETSAAVTEASETQDNGDAQVVSPEPDAPPAASGAEAGEDPVSEDNDMAKKRKRRTPPAANGKAGRVGKFPLEARIRLLTKENPKRQGTLAAKKFAKYTSGMTVGEAIAAGIRWKDLSWDTTHEYITVK
jgi:hypothetical protein